AAWNGFAVAAPEDAAELLRRGWPPERAVVLTNLRLFRYADPAGHERRELLPFVPVAARTVVDVGCGSGLFGSLLRRPGRRVLGIEPEWELARQARTRLDLVLPLSGDDGLRAVRPPVDCVVFADVLEHTVAPHQLLRAAAGALGPGGRIVVSFPNAAWAPVVRALAAGRWDLTLAGVQARDHLFFTTPRSFAALAAECGLAVETMAPLGGGVSWRGRAWAHLLALASGGDPAAMAAPQWMVVLRAS
ncbi:MAG TPA: methyltransferase domain-containing protein, partial [Thermoanaerobaculaceae bacterium]|nr:methyltransferase domain-containing protein [Thermoanaerobaculaceae bacterium]